MKPFRVLRFGWIIILLFFIGCTGIENATFRCAMSIERTISGLDVEKTDIESHQIAFLDGGNGETVLLVHGFGANKENWLRFSRYLTDDYRVVAIDLPGHGESTSEIQSTYDLDSQTARLHQIVEKLSLDRFHLLGSSMGGNITIRYTDRHPERVITMGLMNAAAVDPPHPSRLQEMLKEGKNPLIIQSPDEFGAMMDFVMEDPPFIPWPIKRVLARQFAERRELNEKIFEDIVNSVDLKSILPSINRPAIIIWGSHDRVLDVSSVAVLEELLPNAQSVILNGVGHAPMIERPKEVANLYRDFINNSPH